MRRRRYPAACSPFQLDFLLTDWDHLDFLVLRDPRTNGRGYVVGRTRDGSLGVVLAPPTGTSRARSALCNVCHTMQPADQVSLFSARKGRHRGSRRRTPSAPTSARICRARDRVSRRAARAQRGARERRPRIDGTRRRAESFIERVLETARGGRMSNRVVVIGDALIDELRDDSGVREFVWGAALNVAVGLTRLGVADDADRDARRRRGRRAHPRLPRRLRRRADRVAVGPRQLAGGEHAQLVRRTGL